MHTSAACALRSSAHAASPASRSAATSSLWASTRRSISAPFSRCSAVKAASFSRTRDVCAAAAPLPTAHEEPGGVDSPVGEGGAGAATHTELSRFFPPLLWLLRDFVLEIVDESGAPLAPNAYMERALEARGKGQRRADERNETRAAIREAQSTNEVDTVSTPLEPAHWLRVLAPSPDSDSYLSFAAPNEFVEKVRGRHTPLHHPPAHTHRLPSRRG